MGAGGHGAARSRWVPGVSSWNWKFIFQPFLVPGAMLVPIPQMLSWKSGTRTFIGGVVCVTAGARGTGRPGHSGKSLPGCS